MAPSIILTLCLGSECKKAVICLKRKMFALINFLQAWAIVLLAVSSLLLNDQECFLLFLGGVGACCEACGILVPWPGIKLMPTEMKASLNYWMPGNLLTGILNKVSLNRNTHETSIYIDWLIKNMVTRDSQTLNPVFFLGVMVQYLLIQHLRWLFGT